MEKGQKFALLLKSLAMMVDPPSGFDVQVAAKAHSMKKQSSTSAGSWPTPRQTVFLPAWFVNVATAFFNTPAAHLANCKGLAGCPASIDRKGPSALI